MSHVKISEFRKWCYCKLIRKSCCYLTGPFWPDRSGPASITKSYQASGFLQSRGLKVAHLNIRSIYNKIDSLKLLLNEKPFDIFTISETWLNSDITDGEISIPGYTFSRNDRNGRSGGGTLAFVRDGIPYKIRTDLLSSNIESTVIEITRLTWSEHIDNISKKFIINTLVSCAA